MRKFLRIFLPILLACGVLSVSIWAGIHYNKQEEQSGGYTTKVSQISLDKFLTDFKEATFADGYQSTLILEQKLKSEQDEPGGFNNSKTKTFVNADKVGNMEAVGYEFDDATKDFSLNPTIKYTLFDGILYYEMREGNTVQKIKGPYDTPMDVGVTMKPVKDMFVNIAAPSDLNAKNVVVTKKTAGDNVEMYEFEFSTTVITDVVTVDCTYSCSFTFVDGYVALYSYTLDGESEYVTLSASVGASAWNGTVENVPDPESYSSFIA